MLHKVSDVHVSCSMEKGIFLNTRQPKAWICLGRAFYHLNKPMQRASLKLGFTGYL